MEMSLSCDSGSSHLPIAQTTPPDVPVSYRTASGTSSLLLSDDEQRVQVDTNGPVIVNAGGHAFVRVEYDNELRSRITREVLPTRCVERHTLVDDAIAAVTARRLDASDLLMLTEFRDEDALSVWQSITSGLRLVSRIIGDTDERSTFEETVRNLCEPTLQRLGALTKDEDDLVGSLRGLLTKTVALLGNDSTSIEKCRQIVNIQLPQQSIQLPPLRRRSLPDGDNTDYQRFLDGFRTSQTLKSNSAISMRSPSFVTSHRQDV